MDKKGNKIVIDTPITPYIVGGIMIYNFYNMYRDKKEAKKETKKEAKKEANNLDFNIKKND